MTRDTAVELAKTVQERTGMGLKDALALVALAEKRVEGAGGTPAPGPVMYEAIVQWELFEQERPSLFQLWCALRGLEHRVVPAAPPAPAYDPSRGSGLF